MNIGIVNDRRKCFRAPRIKRIFNVRRQKYYICTGIQLKQGAAKIQPGYFTFSNIGNALDMNIFLSSTIITFGESSLSAVVENNVPIFIPRHFESWEIIAISGKRLTLSLFAIARNTLADYFRRQNRNREDCWNDFLDFEAPISEQPAEKLLSDETIANLLRANSLIKWVWKKRKSLCQIHFTTKN